MADHLAAPPARSRGLPTKTSRPDVRPDGVGLESRETCAQRPLAPGHVLLSLVQASGQISVRALVRGAESAQDRPFAPCRALKGTSLPQTPSSPPARPAATAGGPARSPPSGTPYE